MPEDTSSSSSTVSSRSIPPLSSQSLWPSPRKPSITSSSSSSFSSSFVTSSRSPSIRASASIIVSTSMGIWLMTIALPTRLLATSMINMIKALWCALLARLTVLPGLNFSGFILLQGRTSWSRTVETFPWATRTDWHERGRLWGSTGASQKEGTEQKHSEVGDGKGTGSWINHLRDLEASALSWLKVMMSMGREEAGKLFHLLVTMLSSMPPLMINFSVAPEPWRMVTMCLLLGQQSQLPRRESRVSMVPWRVDMLLLMRYGTYWSNLKKLRWINESM